MTNREINKIKQELYEIQATPQTQNAIPSGQQLKLIEDIAKRIGAFMPDGMGKTRRGLMDALIDNIHIVLQTEMMFNACAFSKWSCFWAAMAAILSCISIIFTMCLR